MKNPQSWLLLHRHVRFGDLDPAGVIHFYHLFRWAHESWEESLQSFGLNAINIFPGSINSESEPNIALPIINCKADFIKPITLGDILDVKIQPEKLDLQSFQVHIKFFRKEDLIAITKVRHLAINLITRERCNLPEDIELWLEASNICGIIKPV